MEPRGATTLPGRLALLPPLLALVAYLPILWIPYAVDSIPLLVERPPLRAWGAAALVLDPSAYNAGTGHYSWRPVSVLVSLLDVNLFGLRAPLSHGLNLGLHALAAWLVAMLACRLRVGASGAVAAGALFAVHPVLSEVVNCAGFRPDLLATTAVLGSVLLWLSFATSGSAATAAGAVALFIVGLGSKESALAALPVAPVAMLVASGAGSPRPWQRMVVAATTMAVAAAVFFLAWSRFHAPSTSYDRLGGTLTLGLANFARIVVEVYLPRILAVAPMRTYHEWSTMTTLADVRLVVAMLVLLAMGAAAALAARRDPVVGVGAWWFVVAMGPVSQLLAVPDPVAERFLYMPMAGVALAIGSVFGRLAGSGTPPPARHVAAAALVLLALTGMTWRRHWDWRDERSLNIANFEGMAEPSAFGLQTLGMLYMARGGEGDLARADTAIGRLLAREPENAEGTRILALIRMREGRASEAVTAAERAVALNPSSALALRTAAAAHRARDGAGSTEAARYDGLAAWLGPGSDPPAFRRVDPKGPGR